MTNTMEKLRQIVGPKGWTTDPDALEPHLTEWRGLVRGQTAVMLSPDSSEQVADILRLCSTTKTAIVPQGGNTGMCAGAVPDESGKQVLLNLSRLNRIRSVDAADFSLIAEAGCVLTDIQAAARRVNRLFPLSHGGEGSCQIGGNLSTNAGGINVLRYGTARDLVLGVEVVLADGTMWDGIRTLRKDTAGYDLKQLFVGSEGTLGIITAAALKLWPAPGMTATVLASATDATAAVSLLGLARERMKDALHAFELISSAAMAIVLQEIPDTRLPMEASAPWYVLIEVEADSDGEALQQTLVDGIDRGWIVDAVIAKNAAESESFWRLRHSISEAEKRRGAGVKLDVSVPIGRIADLIHDGLEALAGCGENIRPVLFGHVGDGNLHFNALLPGGLDDHAQTALRDSVSDAVYDTVVRLGGSISAEHGIGRLKKRYLEHYKHPVELELMRTLKRALDPDHILNPGKVI